MLTPSTPLSFSNKTLVLFDSTYNHVWKLTKAADFREVVINEVVLKRVPEKLLVKLLAAIYATEAQKALIAKYWLYLSQTRLFASTCSLLPKLSGMTCSTLFEALLSYLQNKQFISSGY